MAPESRYVDFLRLIPITSYTFFPFYSSEQDAITPVHHSLRSSAYIRWRRNITIFDK